jgi:hypothetical protein
MILFHLSLFYLRRFYAFMLLLMRSDKSILAILADLAGAGLSIPTIPHPDRATGWVDSTRILCLPRSNGFPTRFSDTKADRIIRCDDTAFVV